MDIKDLLKQQRLLLLLLLVLFLVTALATFSVYGILYYSAFNSQKGSLVEMVKSQARLIDAVSKFDAIYSETDHPNGAAGATLSQVVNANMGQQGFGLTGEFSLGQVRGEEVQFLLPSRNNANQIISSVNLNHPSVKPMKLALMGMSGALINKDHRNVEVLSAYEPLKVLSLGLVAQIDMSEIQAPFVQAAFIGFAITVGLTLLAVIPVYRLTAPFILHLDRKVNERTLELNKANNDLLYMAQHDHLTGLPNRLCFMQLVKQARKEKGLTGLLFIDLDSFKPVNDKYGHTAGDEVLVSVAKRLSAGIRSTDTVARIGGDEFAVLLVYLNNIEDAVRIANNITRQLEAPIHLKDGGSTVIGCSIGIAQDINKKESDEALISRADTAMYKAKLNENSSYEIV